MKSSLPRHSDRRAYIATCILASGSVLFGYDSSFVGTTISQPSFERAFRFERLSESEQLSAISNITSTFQLGALVGALLAYFSIELHGRRATLLYSSVIFILGALLQTLASHDLSWIYAGRTIAGFAVGSITAASPTFIAEISPAAIRGRLTGAFEMACAYVVVQ
jgi:MFS family permease